ncbi:MAG: RNA polymerase sigma factor [Chloroflexi bacterium]|nr:RNA polymerase sigma factor [Chloroflexota bacterium]
MTDPGRTFADFVDAYQTEILRYLRRLTGDRAEADDLFQETFLRALPAFNRLKTGSNHRAWIYRIATNAFLNHRRRQRRRHEVPIGVELATPGRRQDHVHQARATALVCRAAVVSLPPKQRAAFVQRNVLGWDYSRIAEAMGCTRSAARANVYQAARRLRRLLTDKE